MSREPTCWWITNGAAGFRTQARGLAQAVIPGAIEKTVDVRAPWSLAPPALWPLTLMGLDPNKDRLQPPWPDVVVSCGRKAAKAAIAVKRASGGRTLAAHIQHPLAPPSEFDLIIPMRHDPPLAGANVVPIDLALHDVTAEVLAQAAEAWRKRLEALPRPLTGVLLGGSTKRHPFTVEQGRALAERLTALRAEGGLAITPSRRTPEEVKAVLREAFAGDPGVFLWDETGDNPYRGILALGDRLVATGDSVSMVSEAVATGHPVAVFDLGGGKRHQRFIRNLVERGIVSLADGSPFVAGTGLNSTPEAAAALRRLIETRLGA
ncbi:MAG: mitochondrial fission ELM1 family protein [Caulobacteraceae bacterium]